MKTRVIHFKRRRQAQPARDGSAPLVDDAAKLLSLMAGALERAGFRGKTAPHGLAVLEIPACDGRPVGLERLNRAKLAGAARLNLSLAAERF